METDFEALKKRYLSEMMQYKPQETPSESSQDINPQTSSETERGMCSEMSQEQGKESPLALPPTETTPEKSAPLDLPPSSEWTPSPAENEKSFRTETPLPDSSVEETPITEQDPEDTDTAFLVVQVFSANEAIPISDAYVTVTRERNGEEVLIHFALTDESGKTPVMELPALPAELSEESGNPHPYVSYNIRTDHQGYYSVKNVNVPVFGGITSIQPVEMVPVPEKEDDNREMLVMESQAPNL